MAQDPVEQALAPAGPIPEGGLQLALAPVDQVEADVVARLARRRDRAAASSTARRATSISSAFDPRAIISTARRYRSLVAKSCRG